MRGWLMTRDDRQLRMSRLYAILGLVASIFCTILGIVGREPVFAACAAALALGCAVMVFVTRDRR